ncbi:antizyme inhibitor 2-like [Hemiscyllium ocellatum]|uniref:antizyme inhibitor 2-like n=1 Tax=Hemiscyllium ocellatum TaxID=170820 RepID=UPI0029669155|nr:antizyme inhibitor 2-like [Hemiscyllium ocellatum]
MENIINGSEFVILEKGVTIMDIIDQKIKEQMLTENTDAFSVADLGDLVHQHLRWQKALPRVKPFYAVKCNNSKPVAQILAQMGLGFDCASKNEIATILDIGVRAERIIYANPCKEVSHIKYAMSRGVQMMTFDNKDELLKVAMIHPTAKMVLRIAVNDFTSLLPLSEKFGAPITECRQLMEYAKTLNLDIIGVSFHVGSGCIDPKIFAQAVADARVVFDIGIHLGFQMYLLDIGGGFPGTTEDKVTFEEIAAEINPALDIYFPDKTEVQIIAEPGRYYVTSSFTLVVNIIARKIVEKSQPNFNDEEAGNEKTMMYYLNDGLYGSFCTFEKYRALLKPIVYKKHSLDQKLYNTSIWGPTCDAWDHISSAWMLPELEIGDWLLFKDNGAYTISISTMFNGFHAAPTHYAISEEAWETLQNIKKEI